VAIVKADCNAKEAVAMDVTITGVNPTDMMELRKNREFKGIEFTEDDSNGQGDMGIFTVGVPVTLAVIKVLKTWIKERAPSTIVEISDANGKVVYKTKGQKADPDELGRILEKMRPESE
jgi:hypothetical protein